MESAALLDALARRAPIEAPVALVVAHPDDETIGAGASLHLFRNLLLVHVTDGAPRNLSDAKAYGFADAAAYAAARRAELAAALEAGGAAPELAELGAADQQASLGMALLARKLGALLQTHGTQAVITQPYEGGHPDHDATAFIVRCAVRGAMPVLEMASYHAGSAGMVSGCFLDNGGEAVRIALSAEEQARKRAMMDAFATQRATLAPFGTAHELFRAAPDYDFAAPPHDGTLHYERYEWGMTGPRWRALAAASRAELGC
jgi:N-acetylglucosamine malate deacetylase 2